MRKILSLVKALLVIVVIISLQGCVKDTCKRGYTYSYYLPVYKTQEEVRANIKSNPAREIVTTGKLFIKGNYIFLNEVDKGVHIIDNSNPASPANVAFIDIPGNLDIAVKGNTLYADLYTDMVAIDISDPLHVVKKKIVENIFPFRYWGGGFAPNSSEIIVEWQKRDTTIYTDCDEVPQTWGMLDDAVFFSPANTTTTGTNSSSQSPVGKGGSMARFALVNNNLYTVTNSDLNVFDITTLNDPLFIKAVPIASWNIETIFPFRDKLFIGSTMGMFIYSINTPTDPQLEGQFAHVLSCDPVIADDNFAFVTLRSGTTCNNSLNQMDILDISNINDPILIRSYNYTNPHGLSKDGNLLFLCDGTDGLKVLDVADVNDIKLKKQFTGLETYDVIADRNIAIVVAKDGLYQYDYSVPENIRLLSKISIAN